MEEEEDSLSNETKDLTEGSSLRREYGSESSVTNPSYSGPSHLQDDSASATQSQQTDATDTNSKADKKSYRIKCESTGQKEKCSNEKVVTIFWNKNYVRSFNGMLRLLQVVSDHSKRVGIFYCPTVIQS